MAKYMATVSATSNGTANTIDAFMDISMPANESCVLKRVIVTYGGTAAVADNTIEVQIVEKSAIGAGSQAGTVLKKVDTSVAANATVTEKNGATNYAAGTITDTFLVAQFNQRAVFDWMDFDGIRITTGNDVGVNIACNAASIPLDVTMEWEE